MDKPLFLALKQDDQTMLRLLFQFAIALAVTLIAAPSLASGFSGASVAEPHLTRPLRDLPPARAARTSADPEHHPRGGTSAWLAAIAQAEGETAETDPLLESSWLRSLERTVMTSTPGANLVFEGLSNADNAEVLNSLLVPPDPIGDVGPNHYVQMVNNLITIFDKSGQELIDPVFLDVIWNPSQTLCNGAGHGDPVVTYDQAADRWVLLQIGGDRDAENALCVAVSTTGDPLGTYFIYQLPVPAFPDYPKLGVWPGGEADAYVVTTNDQAFDGSTSLVGVYALERQAMLNGAQTAFIRFEVQNINFMLPADHDGSVPPPSGSGALLYTYMDGDFWSGVRPGGDRIEVWEVRPDFDNFEQTSIDRIESISVADFEYTVCGYFVLQCIRQPSTTQRLDPVSEWPMWRLNHRNFGTHQSLVGNFTVDVGNDVGGVRWFELRDDGAGGWVLHQEGTQGDGVNSSFMGSAAVNGNGEIALGYTRSSNAVFPTALYASRSTFDAPGMLNGEVVLRNGGGSQTDSNRWGDYSSMNVDPSDERTFWYTSMYYESTSPLNWKTVVGRFTLTSENTPIPVARFFNPSRSTHFYTAFPGERDPLINSPEFAIETMNTFYVSDSPLEGTLPVVRFFRADTGAHFWTISPQEIDFVNTALPQYQQEGVAFFAFPEDGEDRTPVYRFFNTLTTGHFYTTSQAERDLIIANLPQYIFDGVGFYAYEAPQ
jgi:hypothetical protein